MLIKFLDLFYFEKINWYIILKHSLQKLENKNNANALSYHHLLRYKVCDFELTCDFDSVLYDNKRSSSQYMISTTIHIDPILCNHQLKSSWCRTDMTCWFENTLTWSCSLFYIRIRFQNFNVWNMIFSISIFYFFLSKSLFFIVENHVW
jgi:hypothetical protein